MRSSRHGEHDALANVRLRAVRFEVRTATVLNSLLARCRRWLTHYSPDAIGSRSWLTALLRSKGRAMHWLLRRPGTRAPESAGRGDSIDKVTGYVHAAYTQVGEPGAGNRWHDRVYRICDRLLRSRIGHKLPRWARERISLLLGYALVFHQHELNKVWSLDDPLHNFTVPSDEHVEVPAIWVVELFPPSHYQSLVRAMEHNSWDKRRVWYGIGGPANQAALDRSRTGAGYSWWRLGTVTDLSEGFADPESVRRILPTQFSSVELRALQVGAGLTAVVAKFTVRPETGATLDRIWHETQEPQIYRAKGRQPGAESRQFAAYRRTQNARWEMHQAARDWVARTCPGFFADYHQEAPLLDLMLLKNYDPTTAASVRAEMSDPMRALGLTDYTVQHQTSAALPGLLLEQVREELAPGLGSRRTWTLFGRYDTVIAKFGKQLAGTAHDTRGLSYVVGETVSDFLVVLAGDCFVDTARSETAVSRDRARVAHERFRIRSLKAVRAEVLQMSLDLSTVQRDFIAFYSRSRWEHGHLSFLSDYSPAIRASFEKSTLVTHEPIKLSERLIGNQLEQLQNLVDVDQSYREIVSTAASIGAAISASRLGRVAAVVAVAIFVVALSTLLVASFDPHAPLVELWHWLGL
jgi:hypothetical protein